MHKFNISVLDCTLRDGGHALEDISIRSGGAVLLPPEEKELILDRLNESKLEIVELGSVTDGVSANNEFSVYKGVEDATSHYENKMVVGNQYAIIYRDPHIYNLDIPVWQIGLPRIARVIIRYSYLEKSFAFCRLLASKGYTVFIQPMATTQYSNSELIYLCDLANEITAGALYIVDSYGAMIPKDIRYIYEIFNNNLDDGISIGFHSHDNLNLAYSNCIDFLEIDGLRDRIIDSTLYGMGLGAGNCKTELICSYLNEKNGSNYYMKGILDGCEIVETIKVEDQSWGVGLVNTLPALEGVATKYVATLRKEFNLSYGEIYEIIKEIPLEMRQQYSKENMSVVAKRYLSAERAK